MRNACVLALALWFASTALAAETPAAAEPTLADLVAAQKALRADIASGKQTFAPDNQKTLLKAQDELFAIAADNPADAHLNEDEWVKVYNAQEQINQIVKASAADERVVCRRERPTGSNRKRSVCMTVAEWRSRQTSQPEMLNLSRQGSTGNVSGGN